MSPDQRLDTYTPGTHIVKPIPFKAHRMIALSSTLLESHYENNYGGAVRRLNMIERRLSQSDWTSSPSFEVNGIKREELIACNAIALHEVYFDSLGEDGGQALTGELAEAISVSFGSEARWRAEFVAMGKALAGGTGWVLLVWSAHDRRLINTWASDDMQNLTGAVPLLALDMYEHAYHLDFGANADAYVAAFMQNIHWGRVNARFLQAMSPAAPVRCKAPEQLDVAELQRALNESQRPPLVIDVRHLDDRERSGMRILDTSWRDSGCVSDWMGELSKDQPVVVYCMYGFWVSQDAAAELRAAGLDARSLAGGIAAWRAMGLSTTPIE